MTADRAAPVRVVVDRLVLNGIDVPPGQVDAVVAALCAELQRCVQERVDEPGGWRSAPLLRAPEIDLAAGAPAAEIGRQAGRAVHAALDGGPS